MNIPDKAIEAAVRTAFFEDCGDTSLLAGLTSDERAMWDEQYRNILEAAAPFIAAQALRNEAWRVGTVDGREWYVHDRMSREEIINSANDLEAGK